MTQFWAEALRQEVQETKASRLSTCGCGGPGDWGLIAPLPKEISKLLTECNSLCLLLLHHNNSDFLKSALDNSEPDSYYTIGEVVFGTGGLERRFELEPQRHRGTENGGNYAFTR